MVSKIAEVIKNVIKKFGVGFLRVSSGKQLKLGDSLADQKKQIQLEANRLGVKIVKWIPIAESAGEEKEDQPFREAIEYCKNSKLHIDYCFIRSIDRETRGGGGVYLDLKRALKAIDTELIDVYGVINNTCVNTLAHTGFKYPWSEVYVSEIAEIIVAEAAKKERTDILTRLIGAEIGYVKKGYSVRRAEYGYENIKMDTPQGKRSVRVPLEAEAKFIRQMFELKQLNKSDYEIVDIVNKAGYKSRLFNKRDYYEPSVIHISGGLMLTVKQLRKYLTNTVYCGVVAEYWTANKPLLGTFQSIVSVDAFNKANENKIFVKIESDRTVEIIKSTTKKRRSKNNPLYPFKTFVLCPKCHSVFKGSANMGKNKHKYPAYHCDRGHKNYRIAKDVFEREIECLVKDLKFKEDFKEEIKGMTSDQWEEIRVSVAKESIAQGEQAQELKVERERIISQIKDLSLNPHMKSVVDSLGTDLTNIESQLKDAENERNKSEVQDINLSVAIRYVNYFIEHFEELFTQQEDPFKKAALFGLIFDELPTYEELVNRTLKLSCFFELNQLLLPSGNPMVTQSYVTSNEFEKESQVFTSNKEIDNFVSSLKIFVELINEFANNNISNVTTL